LTATRHSSISVLMNMHVPDFLPQSHSPIYRNSELHIWVIIHGHKSIPNHRNHHICNILYNDIIRIIGIKQSDNIINITCIRYINVHCITSCKCIRRHIIPLEHEQGQTKVNK